MVLAVMSLGAVWYLGLVPGGVETDVLNTINGIEGMVLDGIASIGGRQFPPTLRKRFRLYLVMSRRRFLLR